MDMYASCGCVGTRAWLCDARLCSIRRFSLGVGAVEHNMCLHSVALHARVCGHIQFGSFGSPCAHHGAHASLFGGSLLVNRSVCLVGFGFADMFILVFGRRMGAFALWACCHCCDPGATWCEGVLQTWPCGSSLGIFVWRRALFDWWGNASGGCHGCSCWFLRGCLD